MVPGRISEIFITVEVFARMERFFGLIEIRVISTSVS